MKKRQKGEKKLEYSFTTTFRVPEKVIMKCLKKEFKVNKVFKKKKWLKSEKFENEKQRKNFRWCNLSKKETVPTLKCSAPLTVNTMLGPKSV